MKRIIFHIDSLVLKDFRYENRHAIAALAQDELMRVLAAPGAAQRIA
jgi:hypothetical protein